jgi:tetratricopeptide (TPR) repeat protein
MHKRLILIAIATLMFLGFNCTSDNVTAAKMYLEKNDYEKAEIYLQKEIDTNPYADEGFYLLGYIRAEQKNYNEMNKMFEKSLAISDRFKKKIEEARKHYIKDESFEGSK